VDFALKLEIGEINKEQADGFNPCFGGFCSKTLYLSQVVSVEEQFQSLFWWILL